MINGREYEPVVKFTPPDTLRPTPTLLQQETGQIAPPPPPQYSERDDPYHFDESDEDSDANVHPVLKDDRSLADDAIVTRFWGIVQVSNLRGVEGQHGLEHDNVLRNMLSRNAYLSHSTNTVYVGDSAREACEQE